MTSDKAKVFLDKLDTPALVIDVEKMKSNILE